MCPLFCKIPRGRLHVICTTLTFCRCPDLSNIARFEVISPANKVNSQAMQAFQHHFLQKGYALIPAAISSSNADQLRLHVQNGSIARRKHLIELPLIDNIVKQTSRVADPLYDKLEKKLQQHRRKMKLLKARRRRRLGKSAIEGISGDDVWAMSQKIAEALVGGSSQQATEANTAAHTTNSILETTVATDHQMLSAIDQYQANLWMTNKAVEQLVRSDGVGRVVGGLVREVVGDTMDGGFAKPSLFADMPIVRESFGRSVAPIFAAPFIGVNTHHTNAAAGKACAAWVFTSEHNSLRMPLYVFENSHLYVKRQYWKVVEPNHFEIRFKPMESHTPMWFSKFEMGPDVTPRYFGTIPKGSILLCDPHLFVGMGCNYDVDTTNVLRMLIIDNVCSRPSLRPPSWIRGWRSSAADVPFGSDVVFPHLC